MEKVQAYWFAASDTLPHGDGRKVVIGETHSLKGGSTPLALTSTGSRRGGRSRGKVTSWRRGIANICR